MQVRRPHILHNVSFWGMYELVSHSRPAGDAMSRVGCICYCVMGTKGSMAAEATHLLSHSPLANCPGSALIRRQSHNNSQTDHSVAECHRT